MKKAIFIGALFFALEGKSEVNSNYLYAVPTYTKVIRHQGGFFGYKYINQTSTSNGSGGSNVLLACSDPGSSKCKLNTSTSMVSGNLNDDDSAAIDVIITNRVLQSNGTESSGQFIYNTDFLVVYNYEIDTDKLTYEVYTREEAIQLGLTF
jgi:hypothetical protein